MKLKRDIFFYAALLLIAILAYWQISFFQLTLKYDMIDCSYPWRFIVGEHIQHGMLPLWNPYQNLGYPLFADMQSGSSWYLPVWIIGGIFGYNIYTLSIEFIIHIFLAGAGMFYLGKVLKLNPFTSFLMGVIYMLSGFFVGHSQHFTLIAGATWLPFVLAAYFELISQTTFTKVFKTAFFFFMLFAGGYVTFVVSTSYILMLLFLFYSLYLIKSKEYASLKKFVFYNALLLVTAALLCSVLIFSAIDVMPELTRTEGLDEKTAMLNPFSPQSFLSFILPYALTTDFAFFKTDQSMSNAYIGILPLVFLLTGLFFKQSKKYYFFLVLSVLSMLVAMGDYMPFRKILYDYVPLMNMFRFPAVFRLFTVLGFIVCIGFTIDNILIRKVHLIKYLIISCVFLASVFMSIVIISRLQGYLEMRSFITQSLFSESGGSQIQHIVFQSVVQCFLLLAFAFFLKIVRHNRYIMLGLSIFITVEMSFALQLNAPATIFYENIRQRDVMNHHKNHFVSGFPVPLMADINQNTNAGLSYGPFWRNLTNFHKQISSEGFTSFVLRDYRNLITEFPLLYENSIKNKFVFLTNQILPYSEIEKLDSLEYKPDMVFVEDFITVLFKNTVDSLAYDIELISFKLGKLFLNVQVSDDALLVLLQNNYKGWTAVINDKKTEIISVNKALIGVPLKKGANKVQIQFRKPLIVAGYYISLVSLVMLMLYSVIYMWRRKAYL